MIFKNKAKEKVKAFTNEIEKLNEALGEENLKQVIQDTNELINHNEYGVALENLLSNLYDFDIKIEQTQLLMAKEALNEMKINWSDWKFIEELVIS